MADNSPEVAGPGPAAGGSDRDTPPPPSGDRGYDVVTYDLDVVLDPAGTIVGQVVIRLNACWIR